MRKQIVMRLDRGEKQIAIAADLGVSRQYVHAIAKEMKRRGMEAVVNKPSRGAPRYIPLTDEETVRMRTAMSGTSPLDYGWEGKDWTSASVRKWTKANLGRVFNKRRVRLLFEEWNLHLADFFPKDPELSDREVEQIEHEAGTASPLKKKKAGKSVESGIPPLEEMKQLVRQASAKRKVR